LVESAEQFVNKPSIELGYKLRGSIGLTRETLKEFSVEEIEDDTSRSKAQVPVQEEHGEGMEIALGTGDMAMSGA
jgi:hypothetical protein